MEFPLNSPILVVKPEWLDRLLDGRKTLEIRSSGCSKPIGTRVYLSESKTGTICGSVVFRGTTGRLDEDAWNHLRPHHNVQTNDLPYGSSTHGWWFESPVRYDPPVPYAVRPGSIVWRKYQPVV